MTRPQLVASYVTLSGAGFGEPARFTFPERAKAAAEAGFTGIGIHVNDLNSFSPTDVAGILADHGLILGEIEFLAGWVNPEDGNDAQATLDKVVGLAELVGGDHLSTGDFSGAAYQVDEAAGRLAKLARQAGTVGLNLAIESFAWSALNTIPLTDELFDATPADNVGHLLDVWHFFNSGATLDTIRQLKPGRIAAVQLNDGARVHDNFLWNARNTRWLPGEGEFDVRGFVDTLREWGWDGPWCVEVNYPEYRVLDVDEAARRTYAACVQYL